MLHRDCCRTRIAARFRMLSQAARSALPEPLESRVHLSYDDRGTIAVIVDGELFDTAIHSAAEIGEINASLNQYKQDLIGDGWNVSMHTNAPHMHDDDEVWDNTHRPDPVPITSTSTNYRNDLVAVKQMIAADATAATAAGSQLKAVVLVGHVTVPYSGLTDYDEHAGATRAMPTDQYYADLEASPNTWGDSRVYDPMSNYNEELTPNFVGDGRFDADAAPSQVEGADGEIRDVVPIDLMFGRIDMANLSTAFATGEVDLLKDYFLRDHNYRTATFRPDNAALASDNGFTSPDFSVATGVANTPGDWLDQFTTSPTHYLFASRTGNGAVDEALHRPLNELVFTSGNFGDSGYGGAYPLNVPAHAVFTMVGGSYMGDWNNRSMRDNQPEKSPLLRSIIAANRPGVVGDDNGEALVAASLDEFLDGSAAAAGMIRPDVLKGEPAGEGFRQALNAGDSSIYQEFLGDPSLRIKMVAPVSNFVASGALVSYEGQSYETLSWDASPDANVAGVYRAANMDSAFTRVSSLISGTGAAIPANSLNYVYMVRTIVHDRTVAGVNYDNASQGVFAQPDAGGGGAMAAAPSPADDELHDELVDPGFVLLPNQ